MHAERPADSQWIVRASARPPGGHCPRISQPAAAKAIGASQNKMSRARPGTGPDPDESRPSPGCTALAAASSARWRRGPPRSRPGEVDARVVLRRGGGTAAFQARVRRLERGAELIRAYGPEWFLGSSRLRPTPACVFGGDEAAVAEHLRRGRLLLGDASRHRFSFSRSAHCCRISAGAEVMAEQIDALIEASQSPPRRPPHHRPRAPHDLHGHTRVSTSTTAKP